MNEDLEARANNFLKTLINDSPLVQAFNKYSPLVEKLTDEEYAALSMAVERDRPRRLASWIQKYPFLAQRLAEDKK